MCAATGGPNMTWRAQVSNGGGGNHCPPLATALNVRPLEELQARLDHSLELNHALHSF